MIKLVNLPNSWFICVVVLKSWEILGPGKSWEIIGHGKSWEIRSWEILGPGKLGSGKF